MLELTSGFSLSFITVAAHFLKPCELEKFIVENVRSKSIDQD